MITFNWLANLDEIVLQRVTQQQQAKLLDFQAVVYFSDRRKKTLTSREAFLSFGDNSRAETIGVWLTWVFLVQFPHSSTPERQVIRFKAATGARLEWDGFFDWGQIRRSPISWLYEKSNIIVEVEHTEVTWGDDLINHIDVHVERLLYSPRFLERLIIAVRSVVETMPAIVLYFTFVLIMLYSAWKRARGKISSAVSKQLEEIVATKVEVDAINAKIDLLIRAPMIDSGYAFGLFLQLSLYILILALTYRILGLIVVWVVPESFVVLNKNAENAQKTYEKRRDIWIWALSVAFAINVGAALVLDPLAPLLFGLLEKAFSYIP